METNSKIEIFKKLEEVNKNNNFFYGFGREIILQKEELRNYFEDVYYLIKETRIPSSFLSTKKYTKFEEDQNIFIIKILGKEILQDFIIKNMNKSIYDALVIEELFYKYFRENDSKFISISVIHLYTLLNTKIKLFKDKNILHKNIDKHTFLLINFDWLLNQITPEIFYKFIKPNSGLIKKEEFTKISTKIRKEKINSIF